MAALFEEDFEGTVTIGYPSWDSDDGVLTVTPSEAHSGTKSLQCASPINWADIYAEPGVLPGQEATASLWVKGPSDGILTLDVFGLELEGGGWNQPLTGVWQQLQFAGVIEYDWFAIRAYREGGTAPITWWLDSIVVTPAQTFTRWNGTSEDPLTLDGVWNGSAIVPVSDVTVN